MTVAPQHSELVESKTLAMRDYQAAISSAYVEQEKTMAATAETHAKAVAGANAGKAAAIAGTRGTYYDQTVPLTGELLRDYALIEHIYAQSLSRASYDYSLPRRPRSL